MKALMGLIAGIAAAFAAMLAVEMGGRAFAISGPATSGEALLTALASAPVATQLLVLLAWIAAAFAGAAVAKRVSRLSWPGWVIAGGLALLLAGAFLMPLPGWMQIVAVIGPLAAGLLADMMVAGARRTEVEPAADA